MNELCQSSFFAQILCTVEKALIIIGAPKVLWQKIEFQLSSYRQNFKGLSLQIGKKILNLKFWNFA